MKRLLRALVMVGSLGAVFVPVVAPPVAAAAQEMDPTMVVLDASGSMTAPDAGGQTRMDAAKQATRDFIDGTPDNAPLGLVTYGTGTGSSDAEKEAGCRDITVLSAPGDKDKGQLKQEVDRLDPRGYTPMGNALLKANEQLPKQGKRSIVLVSDGVDTCAPPPVCEVAGQLKAQGTDLVVHTIGFMVDEAARAELRCVAEVTGGTYADASGADSLKATLSKAVTRKAQGYVLPETVVEFSDSKSSAPVVDVGTRVNPARVDAVLPQAKKSYAKVSIPKGHRLQVGYTHAPREVGTKGHSEATREVNIELKSPKDLTCSQNRNAVDLDGSNAVSGYLRSQVQGGEDRNCNEPFYFLEVSSRNPVDVDLTLAAVPEPTDVGDAFNKQPSQQREKEGAPAPADRNPIEEAQLRFPDRDAQPNKGTVVSEIVEGEAQFFATSVEYGQALDITAEVLEDPNEGKVDAGESTSRALNFQVINDLGQSQEMLNEGKILRIEEIGNQEVFGTRFPISFANTQEKYYARAGASWLGGRHFVVVNFQSNNRDEKTNAATELKPVKYRLTFTPVGKAVEGPKFDDSEVSPASTKAEASSSAVPVDAAPTSAEGRGKAMLIAGAIGALTLVAVVTAIVGIIRRRG